MRTQIRLWSLRLLPLLAACGITDVDTPPLEPWEEEGEPFVEMLDAAAIESLVQAGEAEFELVLLEDGVTVGDLAVRTEGDPRGEMIQSRVETIDDHEGRLVLALAGIEVSMAPETRYWIGDEQVNKETFVGRIRLDRAAGLMSPVMAEREPDAQARAPEDGRFVAHDLVLGGDGTPALRMRAGRDHVERVNNPEAGSPDVWLRLVGCRWGLRTRDGTTYAERHRHKYFRFFRFSGDVAEIDPDARTLVLSDGLMIQVARRTWIKRRSGYASSLSAAAEALSEGYGIDASGLGVKLGSDGRMVALKLSLKIEEREEPVMIEFEGVVADARTDDVGTLMTLMDGSTIQLRSTTELVAADDQSPASVEALREALAAGREVRARGAGRLVKEQPLVLDGTRVVLEAEPLPPELDIVDGRADFVDSNGSVILLDGMTVVVTSTTEVVAADANSPASIAELVEMLDQNRRVQVTSEGTLDNPQQITAVRIVLTALVASFEMEVTAVDPFAPGLILENRAFVAVSASTVTSGVDGAPADVFEVFGALEGGQRIRVRGNGYLTGNPNPMEPDSYEGIELVFELIN